MPTKTTKKPDARLVQLHHQWFTGGKLVRSEMKAQREIAAGFEAMQAFVDDITPNHPLPVNAVWGMVFEGSDSFTLAAP